MTYPTALVMHADCGRHDTGWSHPEHQGRLPAVFRAIERESPELLDVVLQREADPASEAELVRVHAPGHVDRVRAAARRAERESRQVMLDADTVVSAASWDAALAAAGCALTAARLVADGEAANAFAATRPPGHHATTERAMGFCLFNNVAVAARYLQDRGFERILIVDWDVHHGNGTQDVFYDDGSIYFLSLHLSPHYPGTGSSTERGVGAGHGATRNVPLPHGTAADAYQGAFDAALDACLSEFSPDFVLVSAGFDCLAGDPLGGLLLEPSDLHVLTRRLLDVAAAAAGGRLVAVLEGGYVPDRVGAGVVEVLRAQAGLPQRV